jgi:hypothetical protein
MEKNYEHTQQDISATEAAFGSIFYKSNVYDRYCHLGSPMGQSKTCCLQA